MLPAGEAGQRAHVGDRLAAALRERDADLLTGRPPWRDSTCWRGTS
jgi:hypothetical protein